MTDLVERKALKLLVLVNQRVSELVAEGLCDEPQKKLMRRMLGDLRAMLDEFEDAYFPPES